MKIHAFNRQEGERRGEDPHSTRMEMMSKGFPEGRNSGGIVLSSKAYPGAHSAMLGAYPSRKRVLFSPAKATTARLRDFVSWDKMKLCMEVMSCMRSQQHRV